MEYKKFNRATSSRMHSNFFIKKFFIIFCLLVFLSSFVFAQHEHHNISTLPPPKTAFATKKYAANKPSAMKPVSIPSGVNCTVNLVVSYKMVNFAGKWRKAIAVNNQIPGPTLHFKEGDHITLNVCNHLDKPTSIHWHGILVPWQMDGVEEVSQKGIPPGCVFHYQFKLYQRGTYWYHAHTGLEEQEGLFGAFVIDPAEPAPYQYTKDFVVVLSDWANIPAEKVLANLKKGGDYYDPRFPLQPSLMKFIHDYRRAQGDERQALINDYKKMQQMRMSIYDLSDIAYDAYLLNGQSRLCPWTGSVKVGDRVRLRFIGAAASTIYRVKIPNEKITMVHVQGNDVQPYEVDNFSIAPGETYDVLVNIQQNKPYIIYAESIDTLGKAYGALVTDPNQCINYTHVPPFPEPKPVTRDMMHNMMMSSSDMNHELMMHTHSKINQIKSAHAMKQEGMDMNMPTEATIIGDRICPPHQSAATTRGTKYQDLMAAVKTNDPNKPVDGIIKMELFGYMGRYIWFINGEPEYRAKPIRIEPNKRYRIIFTNISMMRHPMHIHGHWFILRNGHGEYDPLLHTIEVAPGATAVADIDTDASGQWFFHCHHLYHMISGMSRVFQYSTIVQIVNGIAKPEKYATNTAYLNRPIVREDALMPIDVSLIRHPMAHSAGLYFANYLDVGEDPFHNVQEVTFKGLYGPDYDKLELYSNDAEVNQGQIENADTDIFYWHLISQFWAVKGGANYFYSPAEKPYWQPGIGIEGLMPYFIDTNVRAYYHSGNTKFDIELSRNTQITNNFLIRLGVRSILATKTVTVDEVGSGLNQMRYTIRPYYRLMPGVFIFTEYEHDQDYGAFKKIQVGQGDSASENTLTFGVSLIF